MAAQPSQSSIDAMARAVYEQCLQAPSDYLFSVSELQDLVPGKNNLELTQKVLNELLRTRSLSALTRGSQTVFRSVPKDFAEKVKNMTADEEMLYGYIQESAREGIWTKQLKMKSNMHSTAVNKALKGLERKKYIKSIKSVNHPARNIYMLYELTPSIEVTGGPWFTDSELDKEFVNELLTAITKFMISKSFPKLSTRGAMGSFPPGHTGYPTLNQVYLWVKSSNLTEVDLAEADIRSLLDVLVYDGKIERVVGDTAYRAVRRPDSINGFAESPCGRCPVFALCKEGGPVSASNCVYFEDWLNA
ncbi:RNA polymerase Rpc34 [Tuber magnatum]|uniref:DNA-directed RNA polymerase III subunit RPC6 n=1 Tax=Tuber magnatum TaxID=42249 RepID=A0A317SMI6_9PEZI|nr:RNA polymerase Rpc34 [Tuber magnatum]